MTFLPSLLNAELLRELSRDRDRGRQGSRRAAGARRLVRPSLPPAPGPARSVREDDDGVATGRA